MEAFCGGGLGRGQWIGHGLTRPEVQGGIGAPGPPGLGARLQGARNWPASVGAGHGPHQAYVTARKGVRLAKLAHGDVLGCPLADSGEALEP
jgi:hypothetical protein